MKLQLLFHRFDKRIGFIDGLFHGGDQVGHIRFDRAQLGFEGCDGLGVEIMLQKHHLVFENRQNGLDFRFGAFHRRNQLPVLNFGFLKLGLAAALERGAAVLGDFILPFAEQGIRDVLDIPDALSDLLRLAGTGSYSLLSLL